MIPERRRREIVVLRDGSLWDEATYRDLLAQWAARAPRRTRVVRLSASDPALRETGR